jgi:hypothetical protein
VNLQWGSIQQEQGRNGRLKTKKKMMADRDSISNIKGKLEGGGGEIGKALIGLVSGTLVYYHCAYRNSSLFSLMSDVLIVLLCSLAILGLLFRQLNISYFSLFTLSFPFPQFQF